MPQKIENKDIFSGDFLQPQIKSFKEIIELTEGLEFDQKNFFNLKLRIYAYSELTKFTKASNLVDQLIHYSFNVLKMHRIYLEVFADNERALKLYEKSGFKKEGILRDKILKNGVFKDVLIMGVINNERNNKTNLE